MRRGIENNEPPISIAEADQVITLPTAAQAAALHLASGSIAKYS